MRLKTPLLIFSFLIAVITVQAQTNIEAFLAPGFSYRALNTSVYNRDSINDLDDKRNNWSGGVKLNYAFNRLSGIQLGLMYHGVSFTRTNEDLKFNDLVHPKLGRLLDLSQAAQKNAFFHHKYRYLSIPLIYQRNFSKQRANPDFELMGVGGISADVLIQESLHVNLPGFSIKGSSTHKLESDYNGTPFNINLYVGAKAEIKLDDDLRLNVQPMFNYPILATGQGYNQTYRLYQFAIQVGVSKPID